jgi:hypothetical protein
MNFLTVMLKFILQHREQCKSCTQDIVSKAAEDILRNNSLFSVIFVIFSILNSCLRKYNGRINQIYKMESCFASAELTKTLWTHIDWLDEERKYGKYNITANRPSDSTPSIALAEILNNYLIQFGFQIAKQFTIQIGL